MTPLDYIKKGVLKGDWEIVCEGYERLTGEALQLPVETVDAEKVLQKIVDIISDALDVDDVASCLKWKIIEPTKKSKKKKIKKKPDYTELNTMAGYQPTDVVNNIGDNPPIEKEDTTLQLNEAQKTNTKKEIGGTRLITNDPDPKEIKSNKIKAKRSQQNKAFCAASRSIIQTYNVECNECGKTFKSDRPNGEMGQKCGKCLESKKSRMR